MTEETVSSSYAQEVGAQLRAVRKSKRLSLQAVEAGSKQEFKASVLGAYERGERAISVPRLQRLARYYQVAVDQLLPRDETAPFTSGSVIDLRAQGGRPDFSFDQSAEMPEPVTVDLTRLESVTDPEGELIGRYLGMIQVRRQDFNGKMLTIRSEDLQAMALLFETTPEVMRRRLDELGLALHQ